MKLFKRHEAKRTELVIGLGNHGNRYKNNRHNIGFMVVDLLAERWGETISKKQARSLLVSHTLSNSRVILAKPQTYMNDSGRAVQALLSFYKIPTERMIVIFDDLDLPLGAIRMRPYGGTSGHRGMRSIQTKILTQDYPRMRVGIGRPPGRMDPADYVLQDFVEDEHETVHYTIDRAMRCLQQYLEHGIEDAMNTCNTSPQIP
jgi:PTH1 family peptidyl-tRNA hydrolase